MVNVAGSRGPRSSDRRCTNRSHPSARPLPSVDKVTSEDARAEVSLEEIEAVAKARRKAIKQLHVQAGAERQVVVGIAADG